MPFSRRIFFSPGSMSRRPMYTLSSATRLCALDHLQLFRLETRLEPPVERLDVGPCEAEEEGHWASVQVTRVGRVGGVDVGVCVDLNSAAQSQPVGNSPISHMRPGTWTCSLLLCPSPDLSSSLRLGTVPKSGPRQGSEAANPSAQSLPPPCRPSRTLQTPNGASSYYRYQDPAVAVQRLFSTLAAQGYTGSLQT